MWAFCLCFRGEPLRNAAPNRSQRGGQGAAKHKLNPNLDVYLFFFPLAAKNKHAGNRGKKKKKCDDVSSLSAADGAKRGVFFFGALSHVSGETWRQPPHRSVINPDRKRRHAGALGRPESVSRPPSFSGREESRGKERKPLVASRRVSVRV